MTRLPGWSRRCNQTEANAYAARAAQRVGHERTCAAGRHTYTQRVPEHVHGYALRLRLWAADVAKGLRA